MTKNLTLEQQRAAYIRLALSWDESQRRPEDANRIIRMQQDVVKELRANAEDRQVIEQLVSDPRVGVRIAAATDSLWWDCAGGVAALERIEGSSRTRVWSTSRSFGMVSVKNFHPPGHLDPLPGPRRAQPTTPSFVKSPFDFDDGSGHGWWRTQVLAREQGWSRRDVIEFENDPTRYQIEDPSSNRSRRFDLPPC